MDTEELKRQLNEVVDRWSTAKPVEAEVETVEEPKRELPKDKKVVRTKSQGDRVYLLDEVAKTRQWVTTPELLDELGFNLGDVVEIDDTEMIKYQMSQAIYKPHVA